MLPCANIGGNMSDRESHNNATNNNHNQISQFIHDMTFANEYPAPNIEIRYRIK